jgi:hypothetical protein
MQRRRRTGQPEPTLGPDPIRCASARRTAPAPRRGMLQRARSLNGTAPRIDRPGNRLGRSGNGGAMQGQPCGAKSGAGDTASVVARINPLQSDPDVADVGLGRQRQRQERRPSFGTWRTRSNARLAGNGRWERANGIGRGIAETQAQPGTTRDLLTCAPGTRRRMWTLWTKHGSRSPISLAMYGGGTAAGLRVGHGAGFGRLHGASGCCYGRIHQRASASRTISGRLCFGTLRRRWGTTTARGERPQ